MLASAEVHLVECILPTSGALWCDASVSGVNKHLFWRTWSVPLSLLSSCGLDPEARPVGRMSQPVASLLHTCHGLGRNIAHEPLCPLGITSTAGDSVMLHAVLLVTWGTCLSVEFSLSGFEIVSYCSPNVLKLTM